MEELKVLTLNAWGLLYIAKNVEERMTGIAEELAKGEYDLVALQELWSMRHYDMLSSKLKEVLPYSHYFHSGVIGSGCATFSRYPIVDTFFHQYLHNGYFWDVTHGDWFGGKGAACAVIDHPKRKIYIFNTHLHASYSPEMFTECRTLQIYQLSQLVRHTTRPGDAVLICGDFNHVPDELGLNAILQLANMNDSYVIAGSKPDECNTVNNCANKYCPKQEEPGRIDYILTSDVFSCSSCDLAMQKIPDSDLNFSDHEGYAVTLVMKDGNEKESDKHVDNPAAYNTLKELNSVIEEGEKFCGTIHWIKVFVLSLLFGFFILLPVFSIDVFPPVSTWLGKCIFVLQIMCATICAVYLGVIALIRVIDVKAFRNVSSEIKIRLLAMEATKNEKSK